MKIIEDRFGRVHDYLRISLTDKCNFRCTYCMPHEKMKFAPEKDLMTPDEIRQITSIFVERGVNKIRVTGGEPLLRSDAPEILDILGTFPVQLAITSNGYFIDDYTEQFKRIGLNSINISLDSLQREKFQMITRRDYFDRVMDNIQHLVREGFHVKINCVVMDGVNEHEINQFVDLTLSNNIHVRFIEFMPFKDNRWQREKVYDFRKMLENISGQYDIEKIADRKNDTAKNYKVPGALGTFAVISTITAPFCESCNRLRLSATGKMRNCLFGKDEINLLMALRNGEDVSVLIDRAIYNKHEQLGGFDHFESGEDYDTGSAMITIGG